jgi:enoyl-CoA hydratase
MNMTTTSDQHTSPVLLEQTGRVAVITLNRPETRNALSPALMTALSARLAELEDDPAIGCVVIAGSDDFFAAGADLEWLAAQSHEDMLRFGAGLWPRVRAIRTPLLAAVSGYALGGGCELALTCDIVVASETAEFGQPEIGLGFIPGGGATQRIVRAAGRYRATELILTGRRFGAAEALDLGLVSRVVAAPRWREEALELAALIASRPPHAARLAVEALRAAADLPLGAGLQYERRLFELALATRDAREGIEAFVDKRVPVFTTQAEDAR